MSKLSSCFERRRNFEALSPAVQPQSRLHRIRRPPPPEGDCGEGNAKGNSVDGSSSKETSSRGSSREGNRLQPLEVASLLKLAATNVLFPMCGKPTTPNPYALTAPKNGVMSPTDAD